MTQNFLFDQLLGSKCTSDAVFAVCEDGKVCRYRDLYDLTGRLAGGMLARGVAPGDRVTVQAGKSLEQLALYLAVIRIGAVYQPLNTAYTAAELAYFLADAEPRLLVVDPARVDEVSTLAADHQIDVVTLENGPVGVLSENGLDAPVVARGKDDLAAILYTSGTTGRSKGAMLTHGNLYSNAHALVDHWRFSAEDHLIHALPIFHTHGLFVATNVTLLAGSSLQFMTKFDSDRVIDAFANASCLMGVPTFYTRLLENPRLDRDATASMRLFISGSAPLLADTHEAFSNRTGHAILERYGMTETNMNTSNPYDGARRPGTVGMPLPGVDVRVCDPSSGEPLQDGEIGSIEVKGDNVFIGYWNMPEKTAAEFREDGYFITGDLGRIDDQGYLSIVGRDKDLIISGGFNVYPKEVELAIDELDGVEESAVVGVPHADFGEAVAAVVVCEDAAALTEQQVVQQLRDSLARFKQPKHVFFVDELPRNTMGKVQKNVLRDKLRDRLAHN